MKQKLPEGWPQTKIEQVIDHYELQSDGEAIAEDKAALAVEEALVQVPLDLVANVRALIAKQRANH